MRLVEVVVAPEPRAGVEHALGLAGGVPHVEELVHELFEHAGREADARGQDAAELELLGESKKDGGRGDDGVRAVGSQLVGVAALAVGHRAHLLEERTRGMYVDARVRLP